MLIDTHVHLNHQDLYAKLDEVINEAIKENVKKFIIVGYDIETSKRALEIASKYDNCYCALGFHPTEIKGYTENEYSWLDKASQSKKVVAIGEIGFDLHWDTTSLEEQKEAFLKQIEIAWRNNLPIIIHSRDAMQITYDIIKENKQIIKKGVMHSFSGTKEMAKEFVKLGFYLGISGPVTFKNGRCMKEVVREIDISHLVTETDSPYLTPHPYRGTENSPKYIPLIINEIASIKNMKQEEVEAEIEKNVFDLFGV